MRKNELIQQLNDKEFVLRKLRGKKPFQNGWQNRTITVPASDFNEDENVGLILGNRTGIADIDIDGMGALGIAEHFLPPTSLRFGRATKPDSHRLYQVKRAEGTVTLGWGRLYR